MVRILYIDHNSQERMITVDADPKSYEAAIQALKQHKSKTKDPSISNLEPQDSRDEDATCILAWWNQTGGELLTLYDAQMHPS